MFDRLWIYQKERFPLAGHAPLIAVFSYSAVCFSRLLRQDSGWPPLATTLVSFLVALLLFLQLRIADEFKDFEEDSRYRPYRAVPRGLVSLRELGVIGLLVGGIQFALTLWLNLGLGLILVGIWIYLYFMGKEFFLGDSLRSRHVLYMLSHMVIVPLIDFFATACDWITTDGKPPEGLGWFLAVSYFNGVVLELGRKIRAREQEEVGVMTYSVLWGCTTAVAVWYLAMLVTAALAVKAAHSIDFAIPVGIWLSLLVTVATAVGSSFIFGPTAVRSKRIEMISAVWTFGMYFSLGVAPLLWRELSQAR